jgi:hypothetical protein
VVWPQTRLADSGIAGSVRLLAARRTAHGVAEITEEAELASGESVALPLTFEVNANVGPQSVFYRPDDERLVDVSEFG